MCACAVSIDVKLCVIGNICLLKSNLNCSCKTCTVRIGSCNMMCVTSIAVALKLCINLSTSCNCVLILFKNEHTCALAENEAVTVLIKRN